jgi:putative transposase
MDLIDEIYTDSPYYGIRKITAQLNRNGKKINKKKVARLMKLMGIQAIHPRRNLSQPNKEHEIYPYLLRNLKIKKSNQVWGTDITYIKMRGTWLYLVAILDWFSRYVVNWKLSDNLEKGFCINCLKEALEKNNPIIHNSDQGSQFTSKGYLNILKKADIKISMDGRKRCFDNIFTERLWRTIKYEEVYLNEYESFDHAKDSLRRYFKKYNYKRLHQSLNYRTPAEIYFDN